MHFINLVVNYLGRKYGVHINIFSLENLTRGTSHLKVTFNDIAVINVTAHRCAGGLKGKLDLRSMPWIFRRDL